MGYLCPSLFHMEMKCLEAEGTWLHDQSFSPLIGVWKIDGLNMIGWSHHHLFSFCFNLA